MRNPESIPSPHPAPEKWLRFRSALDRIRPVFFAVAIGAVAGWQIYNPSKRVIEAVVGLVLMFLLWSYSTFSAFLLLIVIFPFPFGINLGHSTFLFTIIIFIIYLVRVSAGLAKIHSAGPFNLPIALFSFALLLSFYNFKPTPQATRYAYIVITNYFGSILLFMLIVNLITNEKRLRRTIHTMMITLSLIILFSILELLFPGRVLIPGWLASRHEIRLVMKGIRLGGPFQDFELLAEYFAINTPIIFYLFIRSRRLATRSLFAGLLLANLFMLFTTVTRGAFISLAVAAIYMAFICRRDLNFVRLISITAMIVLVMVTLEGFVARYTISGSLFDRLAHTTIEKGFVPDSRVLSWESGLQRAMRHPFIGNSPGWDFAKGLSSEMYPHNGYLFILNIAGFFGLISFLFIIYRLMRTSLMSVRESLVDSPFTVGFMKILNVCLVIFTIDQIKIEYLRNDIYGYFIWLIFGLIAASGIIIIKGKGAQAAAAPPSP